VQKQERGGVQTQHCRPYDHTHSNQGYEMINPCVLWEENEITFLSSNRNKE